jgi:hypothetical protein
MHADAHPLENVKRPDAVIGDEGGREARHAAEASRPSKTRSGLPLSATSPKLVRLGPETKNAIRDLEHTWDSILWENPQPGPSERDSCLFWRRAIRQRSADLTG